MFIWKNLKSGCTWNQAFPDLSENGVFAILIWETTSWIIKGAFKHPVYFYGTCICRHKLRRKLTNCGQFVGSAVSFIRLLHQCIQVCIYNWGMITCRKLTYSNIHTRMSRAVFLQARNLLLMNAFQNFAPDSLNTRVMPRFIFIRNQNSFSLMITNTFLSFSVYLKFK